MSRTADDCRENKGEAMPDMIDHYRTEAIRLLSSADRVTLAERLRQAGLMIDAMKVELYAVGPTSLQNGVLSKPTETVLDGSYDTEAKAERVALELSNAWHERH